MNFIKDDLRNKIGDYSFYYDLFILGQSNLEHSMRIAIEGKNLDNVDFTSYMHIGNKMLKKNLYNYPRMLIIL